MRNAIRSLLVLTGLGILSVPCQATSYVMVSDADLADKAAAVAEVRVVSAEPCPAPGVPSTDYQVEVERVIKGQLPGGTLIVRVPGGVRPGGLGVRFWGMPEFAAGERALLFLQPRDDGSYSILHLMLGAFHEVTAGGRRVAVRDLSAATEMPSLGAGVSADERTRPRDAERFADWIAARAAGTHPVADYFATVSSSDLAGAVEPFTFLLYQGMRIRWFEFDTGGTLFWHAHTSGQQGVAGGGFSEFQTAVGVWNQDAQTPIDYRYAGKTTASGGFMDNGDGLNTILFNDPNHEIPEEFDCSSGGVLAIGGPRFDPSFTGVFNGRTYIRALEAEIITNQNIACYLTRSSNPGKTAEEIFGHELGHTLGLGHSCGDQLSGPCDTTAKNDALMRANAHGDGRGARVNEDDLAGVRTLYKAGGTSSAGPTAPGSVMVTLSGLDANLTWSDRSNDEAGFRVYRGTGAAGSVSAIVDLPVGTTSYADLGLAGGTTYRYQVAAFNSQGESKSSQVTVTTPTVTPLSVALALDTSPVLTGQLTHFRAVFGGPATTATWSFGGDEVGFSDEPCDPGEFCIAHLFTTPGSHDVTVTVHGDLDQTASRTLTVVVGGGTITLAGTESLLQSTIFGPRGNTDDFESNVWLHNAGPGPAVVSLTYLPRGAGNPDPEHRSLTLEAGKSLLMQNVLRSLFGLTNTQGSIGIEYSTPEGTAPPDVRSISRSFVSIEGGDGATFGQFVPEDVEADWSTGAKVVTGILDGDGFTATLLAVNLDAIPGAVAMTLTDALGQEVGSPASFALGPRTMRFQQVAQLFPDSVSHPAPFTAHCSSNGIRFLASSTLLELQSEDQIFIPARAPSSDSVLFIPRVAHSASQFNAFLVSQLVALNTSALPTTLHIELWLRGQDNSSPLTTTLSLAGNQQKVVADVIHDLFGLSDGVGALRITWDNAEGKAPRVLTYAFNQSGGTGPRFGMLVDSRTAADATTLSGVDFGAEQSDLFRADFGVVNLSAGQTLVHATLKRADGSVMASADLPMRPQQQLERNVAGIFAGTDIGTGSDWTIETQVVVGGPILTYLANINKSGDIFFVPGRPTSP